MAVGFDARMTAGNSADGLNQQVSGATTISSTGITVGASATLLVIVLTWGPNNNGAPSTVTATWNGASCTAGPLITTSTVTSAIFYKINPAAGANTLTASWTNADDCYMSAVSFTGTDTSTGIKVADSTSNATASITITSSTDGATVANFANNNGTPTLNFNKIYAESPLNPGGGATYQLGGTSNTHTFSGGTNQASVGVHVLAAPGVAAEDDSWSINQQIPNILPVTVWQ